MSRKAAKAQRFGLSEISCFDVFVLFGVVAGGTAMTPWHKKAGKRYSVLSAPVVTYLLRTFAPLRLCVRFSFVRALA
ncbi:MAG: hypothetical protein JO077_05630 [Verrucomicrobia bacterium]|nr:hypothetical protein [Verrucomicrobiota bacterium]